MEVQQFVNLNTSNVINKPSIDGLKAKQAMYLNTSNVINKLALVS